VLDLLSHGGAVFLGQFLGGLHCLGGLLGGVLILGLGGLLVVLNLGGLLGGVLVLRVDRYSLPGLSLSEMLFFLCLAAWVTLGGDGVLDSGGGNGGDLGLPLVVGSMVSPWHAVTSV